jgi:hypothetical protein
MLYSKTTGGFYDRAIHGDGVPGDAVEISDEAHAALLEGQAAGKLIAGDANGKPFLSDRPAPTADELRNGAELQRAAAYREEADPLFFKFQRGSATKEEWLAKIDEIKARFPNPV